MSENYKEKFGVIDETAKTELQLWDTKDQPNALSFGSTDFSTPPMTFSNIVFTHKDAGMKCGLTTTRH